MRITYNNLNNLSNNSLMKILNALNLKPSINYNANRSMLSKSSKVSKFNGEMTEKAIIDFIKNSNKPKTQPENPDYIFDIQPDLYTHKSLSHEERKAYHDALPNANIYTHKSLSHEERKAYHDALPKAGIYETKQSLSHEERKARFDKIAPAYNQIKKALTIIKSLESNKPVKDKTISFDIKALNKENKEYFNKHIGEVLIRLMNVIRLNEEWFCNYYFDDRVKAKRFHLLSAKDLLHQLKNENLISDIELEHAKIEESNYDFFETDIKNLLRFEFLELKSNQEFTFKNVKRGVELNKKGIDDKLKKDKIYQALLKSGDKEAIEEYVNEKYKPKKQYKTRTGNFWKYILPISLNLERYQIFSTIDKRTVKLMTEDNCLIYACKQAGVEQDIIDRMREIIRVRSFPQSKLKEIANEVNITFKVKMVYLDDDKNTTTTKDKYALYEPSSESKSKQTIELLLIDGHYCLNEKVPVSKFFIEHYNEINGLHIINLSYLQKISRYDKNEKRYKINNKVETSIDNIIKACFKYNRFVPISIGSVASYSSLLYKEKIKTFKSLNYNPKFCARLKTPYVKSESETKSIKDTKPLYTFYADFECSTDNIHKAFNICYSSPDLLIKGSIWGEDCGKEFLEVVPDRSLIYFHNLSYDINFIVKELNSVKGTPIIKGSRTMTLNGSYNGKTLYFKDSYAIISKPLKMFPEMFKLKTGPKEVFPYTYYTSTLLNNDNRVGVISEAVKHVKDVKTFINNINTIPKCKLSDDTFDLEIYSSYYCEQDVRILQEGFERFRKDLLEAFNLDAYEFVSICSIANRYFEENVYWNNGNLYDLANKPREFISRCIQGGRCMLNNNEKQINLNPENPIVDFDAVSLYPSAIARLYTVEGIPKVLKPEMLNVDYLFSHLFDDEQKTPTEYKDISAFFVEVVIEEIGIKRSFPQIVVDKEFNQQLPKDVQRSSNTCCVMYLDHIALEDLIKYQNAKVKVLRGYYYDGNRDYTIREVVRKLFELRLKYKKEENPLQEVIKLILNSVYGKTILKPIETKIKFIDENDSSRYIHKNYNSIVEIERLYNSDLVMFKCLKPIVRHYNFCPLGVNILSMSKRIMNEVFTTAEDAGMHIFYQDTDSGHYYKKDIERLREIYNKKYGRELIGKNLGQFHSDFAEIDKGIESIASKSIFVGKKSYIDMLTNEKGSVAFHCRLKGVKQDVIAITANEIFDNEEYVKVKYDESKGLFIPVDKYDIDSKFTVFELYKYMYDGNEVEFDLCKSSKPCFEHKNNFTITTKNSFIRKLKFDQ